MDLHVFMPGSAVVTNPGAFQGVHDRFGGEDTWNVRRTGQRRVGWNNRNDTPSGGVQDVDFTSAPGRNIPIENITFPDLNKMPEGVYLCKIHNWSLRNPNRSGFKAEIECGGNLYQYEYPQALTGKEWVTVAEVTLSNGEFSIKHMLPEATSSKEVWGISTQQFQKVSMVLNSPNHWDGKTTGNRHLFFILEGCVQEGTARGFYNEFLSEDLREHRKVFEVLGSKLKTEESDEQLSGLGFSSTKRDHLLCRVTGSFSRVIKVTF